MVIWSGILSEMMKQLDKNVNKPTNLEPINLGLPIVKELGARWLLQMTKYFKENPQTIVSGFLWVGKVGDLDHASNNLESQEDIIIDTESEFEVSKEKDHNDYDVVKIRDD